MLHVDFFLNDTIGGELAEPTTQAITQIMTMEYTEFQTDETSTALFTDDDLEATQSLYATKKICK